MCVLYDIMVKIYFFLLYIWRKLRYERERLIKFIIEEIFLGNVR